MDIKTLATGSTGNAYLISDGQTRLLLECGMPFRKLMIASGYSLSKVTACLVTHEHNDHARAIQDVLDHGIPVYCSEGTAIRKCVDNYHLTGQLHSLHSMSPVTIDTLTVMPFATEHDAAEPLGFMIYSAATGDRLLFATDTARLDYDFPGLTDIMIECNHMGEESMADTNAFLAERVLSSHMSLDECLRFLRRQDLSEVRAIRLIHLSSSHADPAVMKKAVAAATGKPVIIAGEERSATEWRRF